MSSDALAFGRHVRGLRRARKLTQDETAKRAGLSVDSIRGIEAGKLSPSLLTLRKLCLAFDLLLSVLFESFELGERDRHGSLLGLLRGRSDRELEVVISVVRVLLEELGDGDDPDQEDS